MGKKKKGPSCGYRGAEPMASLAPTDKTVFLRGTACQVWYGVLPSGALVMLAVPASLPCPQLPGETPEGINREMLGLERPGFPDAMRAAFQSALARAAVRQASGEEPSPDTLDAEGMLVGMRRILAALPARERAGHLARLAAACGFTAGDAFAFLDALPVAAQGERFP